MQINSQQTQVLATPTNQTQAIEFQKPSETEAPCEGDLQFFEQKAIPDFLELVFNDLRRFEGVHEEDILQLETVIRGMMQYHKCSVCFGNGHSYQFCIIKRQLFQFASLQGGRGFEKIIRNAFKSVIRRESLLKNIALNEILNTYTANTTNVCDFTKQENKNQLEYLEENYGVDNGEENKNAKKEGIVNRSKAIKKNYYY